MRCQAAGVKSVRDIMDMLYADEDKMMKLLNDVLENDQRKLQDVAKFVNSYTILDVAAELQKGDYTAGSPIELKVTLSRDVDEDAEDDQVAVAPLYPKAKMVNWWIVVGDATRQLLAIKRVTVKRSLTVKLEITLPKGEHELKLYVVCDSYADADLEEPLGRISVAEGDDSDEDMESGSAEE